MEARGLFQEAMLFKEHSCGRNLLTNSREVVLFWEAASLLHHTEYTQVDSGCDERGQPALTCGVAGGVVRRRRNTVLTTALGLGESRETEGYHAVGSLRSNRTGR